jgi:RNA polymerase sigma factor (sigma-70 family)
MREKERTEPNARVPETLRARGAACRTDGQLLEQFLAEQDDNAFATLMARHGPMVLGVCSRILGRGADADDAFQAAFLVLLRRADSLRARLAVGDWLHGVARRTALNAKRLSERRRVKERSAARPAAQPDNKRDDRVALVGEELNRLPEKYRLPVVLCDLEGRTRQEAAQRLGWPEGTVAGRLARGRAMLARYLIHRGIELSAQGA